jgi:hypothetical protein
MAVAGGVGQALIQSVGHGGFRTSSRAAPSVDEQGPSTTVYDFEIQALNEKGVEEIARQ